MLRPGQLPKLPKQPWPRIMQPILSGNAGQLSATLDTTGKAD